MSALLLPGEGSLVVDGASAAPIINQHWEDPSYFGLHLKSSFFLIGVHVNLAVDLPFFTRRASAKAVIHTMSSV